MIIAESFCFSFVCACHCQGSPSFANFVSLVFRWNSCQTSRAREKLRKLDHPLFGWCISYRASWRFMMAAPHLFRPPDRLAKVFRSDLSVDHQGGPWPLQICPRQNHCCQVHRNYFTCLISICDHFFSFLLSSALSILPETPPRRSCLCFIRWPFSSAWEAVQDCQENCCALGTSAGP